MQVCLHNRKSQSLKNNVQYHHAQQKLNYWIHAHVTIIEGHPCHIQITPQHDSLKARMTVKFATVNRCQIYKHNTFLGHKVIRALPNATEGYCSGHKHTLKQFWTKNRLSFLPGNSSATKMRPKRPWPPPKQTCSDCYWCLVFYFQLFENKQK